VFHDSIATNSQLFYFPPIFVAFWGEEEIQVVANMGPAKDLPNIWPTTGLSRFEMDSPFHAFVVGVGKLIAISFTVGGGLRGGMSYLVHVVLVVVVVVVVEKSFVWINSLTIFNFSMTLHFRVHFPTHVLRCSIWALIVLHFARDGTITAGSSMHCCWHECSDYKNITCHDAYFGISIWRALRNSWDFDGIDMFPLRDFLHGTF
jgi:hypothetical protein